MWGWMDGTITIIFVVTWQNGMHCWWCKSAQVPPDVLALSRAVSLQLSHAFKHAESIHHPLIVVVFTYQQLCAAPLTAATHLLCLCREKVRLLSEYGQQQPLADSEVFTMGGLALMPRGMSMQLQQDLQSIRQVLEMPRPSMTDASEEAAACWDTATRSAMLGAAGLVRFLIDSYPDDLPEYDPL